MLLSGAALAHAFQLESVRWVVVRRRGSPQVGWRNRHTTQREVHRAAVKEPIPNSGRITALSGNYQLVTAE
jgi:hypothetical protein